MLTPALLRHLPGDQLRQEEGPSQVDVHQPIVALLRGFEDVQSPARRHARVVHQQIDRAQLLGHGGEQPISVCGVGDVGIDHDRPTPQPLHLGFDLAGPLA
jgi:hypothetical protein